MTFSTDTNSCEVETAHRFVLVDEADPKETEVCRQCGAQRDCDGPLEERATITGGWPNKIDCDLLRAILDPEAAAEQLPEAERRRYEECRQSCIDARLDEPRSHR